MAVGAFHHEAPAQALPPSAGVVEVGERMRHGGDAFGRRGVAAARPFVLARQAIGQAVQGRVEGARHVGVGRLGPAKWGRRVRGQLADERGEQVTVAHLSGLDESVHVDIEQLLLEGAGKDAVAQVLHPGQQRQIQVVTAVPAEHVHPEEDLALRDLLARSFALRRTSHTELPLKTWLLSEAEIPTGDFVLALRDSHLAELHAALIEDPLQHQLEESVLTGFESRLAQLPVRRDELCHHGTGLLKTLHPGCARVPILPYTDADTDLKNPIETKH